MNPKIECTYCDGDAVILKMPRKLAYRKELFKVIEHFYKCQKCEKEFTTTETDELTIVQLHNQYREKFNIPFVEEICSTRERYNLSAAKMSEVLGLGANGYSNFEKGEVPSPALGNLIRIAANPTVFRSFIENAKTSFSQKAFEKVTHNIDNLIHEKADTNCVAFNWFTEPNSYTGFKKPSLHKVVELLAVLISNCKSEFNDRLKLNKLLFYADFLYYSRVGRSITGLTYRAVFYGPVPTYYDNIFSYLSSDTEILSKWTKDSNGAGHEFFVVPNEVISSILSSNEVASIDIIIKNFKETPSWELVELSHQERAWKELEQDHEIINYQEYAFDLKSVSNN